MAIDPSDIGRVLRVDYRFKRPPGKAGKRQRHTREFHYCVIIGFLNDSHYVVAPLSHQRAKSGAGDIQITPPQARAAKIDERPHFIEKDEFNIVSPHSSSIQKDRRSGRILRGRLTPKVVNALKYDFETKFRAGKLDPKIPIHPDDTSKYRSAHQKLADAGSKAAQRQRELGAIAQERRPQKAQDAHSSGERPARRQTLSIQGSASDPVKEATPDTRSDTTPESRGHPRQAAVPPPRRLQKAAGAR